METCAFSVRETFSLSVHSVINQDKEYLRADYKVRLCMNILGGCFSSKYI